MDYSLGTYISWFILIFILISNIVFYEINQERFRREQEQKKCKFLIPPERGYNKKRILIIITLIFTYSCFTTWALFELFPAIPNAPNIVTVFAGILGSIGILIQLYLEYQKYYKREFHRIASHVIQKKITPALLPSQEEARKKSWWQFWK